MVAAVLLAVTLIKVPVVGCDSIHFLGKSYQDFLGRPLDVTASNYCLRAMKNGMTRAPVASQMIRRSEYRAALAREFFGAYLYVRARQRAKNALYTKYLHHAALAGAFSMSPDHVVANVIGSAEYCRQ